MTSSATAARLSSSGSGQLLLLDISSENSYISGVTSVATVDSVPSQGSGQTLLPVMNSDKESHAWEWTPVVTCGHRLNGLPRRWRTCACQMASPGVVGNRFGATSLTSWATAARSSGTGTGPMLLLDVSSDKKWHVSDSESVVKRGDKPGWAMPSRWRTCACQTASPGVVGHKFCATQT